MNQTLNRVVGTINYNETDPYKRAVIDIIIIEAIKKIMKNLLCCLYFKNINKTVIKFGDRFII
jgi:hypothetical protein